MCMTINSGKKNRVSFLTSLVIVFISKEYHASIFCVVFGYFMIFDFVGRNQISFDGTCIRFSGKSVAIGNIENVSLNGFILKQLVLKMKDGRRYAVCDTWRYPARSVENMYKKIKAELS